MAKYKRILLINICIKNKYNEHSDTIPEKYLLLDSIFATEDFQDSINVAFIGIALEKNVALMAFHSFVEIKPRI